MSLAQTHESNLPTSMEKWVSLPEDTDGFKSYQSSAAGVGCCLLETLGISRAPHLFRVLRMDTENQMLDREHSLLRACRKAAARMPCDCRPISYVLWILLLFGRWVAPSVSQSVGVGINACSQRPLPAPDRAFVRKSGLTNKFLEPYNTLWI